MAYNHAMEMRLAEALRCLSRTPAVLRALLEGLPEQWVETSEEEWTIREVVGHLIHGERTDWVPRIRIILAHGESRPFDPFDMTGHFDVIAGRSLDKLLDEFQQMREANVREVEALSLQPADLERTGMHPALGPMTLGEYIAAWAVHDWTHINQTTRILAGHYANACGPLRQYMGVFRGRTAG
ncbi:MAG: DinB family protein [Bryobacterales bacterium]|nr:DinB family protein [Bryobacterales bacterium]